MESSKKREIEKAFFRFVIKIGIICLVILFIFRVVLMLCVIPSESMTNTLKVGDLLVGTRYDAKKVHRYDIMVFIPPDHENLYYIKRVIGMPGDTVRIKNGDVYVNGKLTRTSFVNGNENNDGSGTYKVPKGHYFMMGDNRNNSDDSRFWKHKYVPEKNLACHARLRVYPFNRMKILKQS